MASGSGCNYKKVLEQERKKMKTKNKKVGMLLQKRTIQEE